MLTTELVLVLACRLGEYKIYDAPKASRVLLITAFGEQTVPCYKQIESASKRSIREARSDDVLQNMRLKWWWKARTVFSTRESAVDDVLHPEPAQRDHTNASNIPCHQFIFYYFSRDPMPIES